MSHQLDSLLWLHWSDLHDQPQTVHECPHAVHECPHARYDSPTTYPIPHTTEIDPWIDRSYSHDQHDKVLQLNFVVLASRSLLMVSRPSRLPRCQYDVATTSWADHAVLYDFSGRKDRDLEIGSVWPGLNSEATLNNIGEQGWGLLSKNPC